MMYLLVIFVLINQSNGQNFRKIEMFSKIQKEFSCSKTSCLPFRNLTVQNRVKCQIACLTQSQCEAASFYRRTLNCQLFNDIYKQITNMSMNINTDTMIVIEGTRIPIGKHFCLEHLNVNVTFLFIYKRSMEMWKYENLTQC